MAEEDLNAYDLLELKNGVDSTTAEIKKVGDEGEMQETVKRMKHVNCVTSPCRTIGVLWLPCCRY